MNAQARVEKAKKDTGTIAIHGKEYQTVALRVSKFREAHPDWSLTTGIMCRDPECVVMQATIADDQGRILATGHAEEYRKSSQINKTSALENAETSAIGRALAALGFGGTEFATANEVANAIHQQGNPTTDEPKPNERQPGENFVAREVLEGPYTSGSALRGAIKAFAGQLTQMNDLGEFTAWMGSPDVVELEKQALRYLPGWWDTGEGCAKDFEPMTSRIHRKRKELEELENIHDTSGAKYVNAG